MRTRIIVGSIPLSIVAACVAICGVLVLWLMLSLAPQPWVVREAPLPALHAAAAAGDLQAIDQCLSAGDPIDLQAFGCADWPDGTTPLMIAAQKGDEATTQALLDRNADPEFAGATGDTALHWAAAGPLKQLLDRGADINVRNRHGQTPLTTAAVRARTTKDLSVVRLLIEAGTDLNARDHQGRTAIGILRTWPDPDPEVIRLIEEAGGT